RGRDRAPRAAGLPDAQLRSQHLPCHTCVAHDVRRHRGLGSPGMITSLLRRRTTGSVVCPSCGSLVGVRDDRCYTCGRANPGLWGFAPMLRQLGNDLGFVPLVIGASTTLYALTLLLTLLTTGRVDIVGGGRFSFP